MPLAKGATNPARLGKLSFALAIKLAVGLGVVGGLIIWLMIEVDKVRESAARAHCNLSGVNLALHSYHEQHGQFPPPYLCTKYGVPLLSWRVLLLPFIEQAELFRQFKLDEPWDSPHNIQLLPKMPTSYELPLPGRIPPHHTMLHVFVGKGTAFEGSGGLRLKEDFPDGTGNTILIVEAGPAVPWTKPEELAYDPALPLPDLTSYFRGGFRVGLADGTMRFIKKDISETILRGAITRNGGELISLNTLD